MTKPDGNPSTGAASSTRRDFFGTVSDGIYGAALTSLLSADLYGDANELRCERGLTVGKQFRNPAEVGA